MSDRNGLEAVYRRTDYVVHLAGGELVLHIGVADPAADERLRGEAGCVRRWALVTPCNPRSRPLTVSENSRRHDEFRAELDALRVRSAPAVGRDPDGQWDDERGFLLLDPAEGLAVFLALEWEQNAIVVGELGAAPELMWDDENCPA